MAPLEYHKMYTQSLRKRKHRPTRQGLYGRGLAVVTTTVFQVK